MRPVYSVIPGATAPARDTVVPTGPANHPEEEAHERSKCSQGIVMPPTGKKLPCDYPGLCPLMLASFPLGQRRWGPGVGLNRKCSCASLFIYISLNTLLKELLADEEISSALINSSMSVCLSILIIYYNA